MKQKLFNLLYTTSFILTFSVIAFHYTDDFAAAFFSKQTAFAEDENFSIKACQRWSEQVRNFEVKQEDQAQKVPVLMYHHIIDDQDIEDIHFEGENNLNDTVVLKSEFEKQMAFLKEHNYTTLTAAEFALYMEGKLRVPSNSVLITFDDGFKDNYMEAYSILKKHDFKAMNFLITSKITEKDSRYKAAESQYLSKADLKESCDVFDFQSHTYQFHQQTSDNQHYLVAKNKTEIMEDLQKSFFNLENRNFSFAYPYGAYDEETIEALQQLEVTLAFTSDYKDAKPGMNKYEIPRKAVFPEDTLDDFKKKIGFSAKQND